MGIRKKLPILFSCVWLAASLFAIPLVFLRLSGRMVPLYGCVEFITLPILCLSALAILFVFPERILPLFRDRRLLPVSAASMLFFAVIFFHFASGGITFDLFLTALFPVTAGMMAISMAGEFKKILPYFASAAAVLFIWSGFFSELFTGFCGNWNWTQGMIAAFLPGLFMIRDIGIRKTAIFSAVSLLLFFLIVFLCFPHQLSRSAVVAVISVPVILFARSRMSDRVFNIVFIASAVCYTGLLLFFVLFFDLPDTRFQIWKGAVGVISHFPVVGCGQFSEYIRPVLGEGFFFTAFPAPHISHAHNDLLNIFAEYGVSGALFFFAALYAVLACKASDAAGYFVRWIFLVLIVCGQFDMHNTTVVGMVCLAASWGAAIGGCGDDVACVLPRGWQICGYAAAAAVFAGASLCAYVNLRSTMLLRRGEIALTENRPAEALEHYNSSIRWKISPLAAYRAAELELLVFRRPKNAALLLEKMESELAACNYMHTRRLRSMAAFYRRDFGRAAEEFYMESANCPFSLINADFQRNILRSISAPQENITAADEWFFHICRLRGVAPEQTASFTVKDDDICFSENVRQEFWK